MIFNNSRQISLSAVTLSVCFNVTHTSAVAEQVQRWTQVRGMEGRLRGGEERRRKSEGKAGRPREKRESGNHTACLPRKSLQ